MDLTRKDILNSKSTIYDLGNSVLYDLCSKNFAHSSAGAILAKTILIGRAYAVALDRGKDKGKSEEEKLKQLLINDDFYQHTVVPLFMNSDLDDDLSKLRNIERPEGHVKEILLLHNKLVKRLKQINKQDKTSFCSKYLHFHLPNLFFIYDSRAKSVINQLVTNNNVQFFESSEFDDDYAKFYSKALFFQQNIEKEFAEGLTPRQIDNLFLIPANEKLRTRLLKKFNKQVS